MERTGATAVSVVLFDRDRILWSEAFGLADPESKAPATTMTIFPCASLSKLLPTLAVLMLVDRGLVALDAPLAQVLGAEAFAMPLDARHREVTVRMLLNHSSGLPGNDDRDATTADAFTGYADQVLAGLRHQRLKHAPGALAAYNNDGFTLVEPLVRAVTGLDFRTFVRREILDPLGMARSRYDDGSTPMPDDRARAWAGGAPQPHMVINVYGSGGLYATPEEFARIGRLFLNQGRHEGRALVSPSLIAATGEDQTLGTFNPVPCEGYRFGLGWDTMAQPGLAAVGIPGWQKTGDFPPYAGTNVLLLPQEGLGAVVFGASGDFTSDDAARICERLLIRALVGRARIEAMPAPMSRVPRPSGLASAAERARQAGFYASTSALHRLGFETDGGLLLERFGPDGWLTVDSGLRLRDDGWHASDTDPVLGYRVVEAGGRRYLARRRNLGMGHYPTIELLGERVERVAEPAGLWREVQLDAIWLPVNGRMFASFLDQVPLPPAQTFVRVPGLPDYVVGFGGNPLRAADPPSDDRLDGNWLLLPFAGKHVKEAMIEMHDGQRWLRSGSWLCRPASGVPALDADEVLVVGPEGFDTWRRIGFDGTLAIRGAEAWLLYDPDFALKRAGRGDATGVVVAAEQYLLCHASAGARISFGRT